MIKRNTIKYFTSNLIIFLFIYVFVFPRSIQAISFPVDESFDDNNVHDFNPLYWEEIQYPSAWTVDNYKYTGTVGPNDFESKTVAGYYYWNNYTFEFDITGNSGPDRTILYMYNPDNISQYYWLKYFENDYYASQMLLTKQNAGVLATSNDYSSHIGETHNIKISLEGHEIHIYFDNKKVIDAYDPNPIPYGKVGFEVMKSGIPNATNSVTIDNVRIYENRIITFNLPINYSNRDNPSQTVFQSEFWNKMTASFDHNRERKVFTPFTRDNYDIKDCPKSALGITCYDGHNGTDFRPSVPKANEDVFPVANGKIVYASDISENGKCNSEKSGYGCVVVMYHPDLDVYTLYAHLSEISKSVGDSVVPYTESIGKMGNTGCYPCGVHIHLGTLKDKTPLEVRSKMKKSDWENLFMQVEPKSDKKDNTNPKHYCTYKVPNGNILTFQDPSGWSSETQEDPWSLSKELGGCSTDSPYLWIQDIGTTHPEGKLPRIWYSE